MQLEGRDLPRGNDCTTTDPFQHQLGTRKVIQIGIVGEKFVENGTCLLINPTILLMFM